MGKPKSCRVIFRDMEGAEHAVLVQAESLYEAVAAGIAKIRTNEWAGEIAGGLDEVKVIVLANEASEHSVRLGKFHEWLERRGTSPRDIVQRNRVREILKGAN